MVMQVPILMGNVLTNDTDPDTGDTKTVTTTGTFTGTYGTLTLNADGSYTYTLNNNNATVQALLPTSAALVDTFNYTIKDAAGLTSSSTLTVNINGQDDAPVWTSGTAVTMNEQSTVTITGQGYSFTDVDAGTSIMQLTIATGNQYDLLNVNTGTTGTDDCLW